MKDYDFFFCSSFLKWNSIFLLGPVIFFFVTDNLWGWGVGYRSVPTGIQKPPETELKGAAEGRRALVGELRGPSSSRLHGAWLAHDHKGDTSTGRGAAAAIGPLQASSRCLVFIFFYAIVTLEPRGNQNSLAIITGRIPPPARGEASGPFRTNTTRFLRVVFFCLFFLNVLREWFIVNI